MQLRSIAAVICAGALLLLAACHRETPKPPERLTPVSTSTVTTRDLPVTESAVGAETAVDIAQEFDPTRDVARRFYIRLPFPITVVRQLHIGQAITLTNYTDGRSVAGSIRQILPALNSLTQTIEVIAEVAHPGRWRPEGSVRGEVVLGVHMAALVVPEQAVTLRPAGSVIYVLDGTLVHERKVTTGIKRDGSIEILDGAKAGETVAVDGAALLSDGAKVKVRDAAGAPAAKAAS
jgi:membrane fusion protein, multidrug efflux system